MNTQHSVLAPGVGSMRGRMRLEQAVDAEDYWSRLVGRFFASERFFHFCSSPQLSGCVAWGTLDRRDVELLTRSVEYTTSTLGVHAAYLDLRRFRGVELDAFGVLKDFMIGNRALFAANYSRMAATRPEGILGAVVAGLATVLGAPHPVMTFTDGLDALAWLGDGDPFLLDELDRISSSFVVPPLVAQLRSMLEARPGRVTLSEAARSLRVSERTLHRRLGELGTRFQSESNFAQVRVAQKMLRDPGVTLTRIAFDVGCASLPHFSGLFRRVTGETPSAWRARQLPLGPGE